VTASQADRAYDDLAGRDPVLARLIGEHGHPDPFGWHDEGRIGSSMFAAMLLHIVGQQISTLVAFAIYDRISAATGGIPTPEAITALGREGLRACGMSRAKADYALALAEAETDGTLDIEHLDGLGDDEIVARLTAVRGIGAWSAEMFMVFNLGRSDVLPAGDLGIRKAVQLNWELERLPSPKEVKARGAAWTPWRTYAGALLWRSLRPGDDQVADVENLQRPEPTANR
jgi:DNA-3-methyladenine glycosylase II